MPGGEYPRDLADRGADRLACPDQGREPPAGRHPAHRHQLIAYPPGRVAYLRDPQVHVGGEPPVELDLALARRRACFRRAEIQEAEVDGLLQLVRAITGKEHHGGMRFRDIRIGLMRKFCRHQVVALSHFNHHPAHVPGWDRSAAGPHVLVRRDSCPSEVRPAPGPGWRWSAYASACRLVGNCGRPGSLGFTELIHHVDHSVNVPGQPERDRDEILMPLRRAELLQDLPADRP